MNQHRRKKVMNRVNQVKIPEWVELVKLGEGEVLPLLAKLGLDDQGDRMQNLSAIHKAR